MNSDRLAQEAIGVFDVALSFAADGVDAALLLCSFADFYGVRCYHYQQHLVPQSGLDIRGVMSYVYATSSVVVIVNSPIYRGSAATRFELNIIAEAEHVRRVAVLDFGGPYLDLPKQRVDQYAKLTDEVAISVMRSVHVGDA